MFRQRITFLILTAGLVFLAGRLKADDATPVATTPTGNIQPTVVSQATTNTETPLREAMKAAGQLADEGKTDEAIAAYEKIGELKNKKTESWVLNNEGLAYLEASTNEAEKAIPILEKAVADQPDNAVAWNNLGIAYERNNQPDQAMNAYQKSIDASKATNTDSTKAEENLKILQSQMQKMTVKEQKEEPTATSSASATPMDTGTSATGAGAAE